MFPLRDWFLSKKEEHTAEWGNNILRFIRWNMQPLVNADTAAKGMSYLLGQQSLQFVKDLFQNTSRINLANQNKQGIVNQRGQPVSSDNKIDDALRQEMASVNFKPLPLLEKQRNIIAAEMKKVGIILDIISSDPTSKIKKNKDAALIKNKLKIEKQLSDVYTSIGQPPVKLNEHQDRFGEKADNGNTADFDMMGFDPKDPSDISAFMQYFFKLDEEIAALSPVEFALEYNRIKDKISNWVNDMLAKKSIAAQCRVSDVTGAIMLEYVAPETVYIYGGGQREKDFSDANAKVIEKRVTVKQMLDTIGNSFDIKAEWNDLLVAISFTNGVEFTGIGTSPRTGYMDFENNNYTITTKSGGVYGYNQFMDFKVTLGYAEWSSQIEDQALDINTRKDKEAFYQDNQPKDGERYQSKARYETPTYKCYYLAVSAVDQVMFNFGLQTYQQIEGSSDCGVNFTIITYKEIGDPIAIMCIPYIDVIHEAWYKWRYEVRRAKARGTDYNYDSLLAIGEDMFSDTNLTKNDMIQKTMQLLDSSPNGIWTFPIGPDGKPVMIPNAQLNPDKPNGLTSEIQRWWEIIVSNIEMMNEITTGSAPLRQGDPGGSRDSMNNQFKALEYSQNSTYYIPDSLTYIFQQMAVKTLLYVEDIIQYRKYDTLAWNWLVDGVGEECLYKLSALGKKSLHRYGIFVESLNQTTQMQKLSQRLDFALQNGKINNAEALLVEDIKSPKKAFLILSFFEQRTARLAQQNAMQQQQAASQQAISLEQEKQKTESIKGNFGIQEAQITANATIQSHLINQQGSQTKQAMKQSADVEQIYHEANANIIQEQASLNTTGKTTPAPQQFPQPQQASNGPAPQAPVRESGIQEGMREAQPVPTSVNV